MRMSESLTLPCGSTLPNRLAKAAMTEGLSDAGLNATERHAELYGKWSDGGAGMLLTGNVMIDRRVLERPGNVAIDRSGHQVQNGEEIVPAFRLGHRKEGFFSKLSNPALLPRPTQYDCPW